MEKLLPLFLPDALEKTIEHTVKVYGNEYDPVLHGRYYDYYNTPRLKKAFYREITDYYKKKPFKLISRIFLKTYYFFYWDYLPVSKTSDGFEVDSDGNIKIFPDKIKKRMFIQRVLHWIAWPVIAFTFFIGLFFLRKINKELFYTVFCIFFGYFLMIIIFSIPAVKNRIPIEAAMYISCGFAVFEILKRFKRLNLPK